MGLRKRPGCHWDTRAVFWGLRFEFGGIMARRQKYPTWRLLRRGMWVSEEARDGVPDFILERLRGSAPHWWLKSRTSAMYERYNSADDAKRAVARSVK